MPDATSRNNIDAFLRNAEKHLRHHLLKERLNRTFDEVRDHLTLHAEELVASGMSRADADLLAVGAFGRPESLARGIVDALYSDRVARWAYGIALGSAVIALVSYLMVHCYQLFPQAFVWPIGYIPYGDFLPVFNCLMVCGCLAWLWPRSEHEGRPWLRS